MGKRSSECSKLNMARKLLSAIKNTGGGETRHPHSTQQYVEWMSDVWRLNSARNKQIAKEKHMLQDLDCIIEIQSADF